MYQNFYGLKEEAFRLPADPRFIYYGEDNLEAKERIMYNIQTASGPVCLIAPVGTGKTLLAKRIIEELSVDETKKVVYVFSPKLPSTNAFLKFIMSELEIPGDRSYAKSLDIFQNYLINLKKSQISPVLILDEAQNMSREMLLLIQHFYNFSTDTEQLIQIVMLSQPDLYPRIKQLPSLHSRLLFKKLSPLDREQTKKMMEYRWMVAGAADPIPFSDNAITEVFERTGGVPRLIVKLANESLIKGAVDGLKQIDKDTVAACHYSINYEI